MGRHRGWIVVLMLVACNTEPSPVEKCDDLVDVLCTRATQCVAGTTHTECVQAVKTGLPCGSAKDVTSSYDRCIDQLNGASCNVLFSTNPTTGELQLQLPADCKGTILTVGSSEMATEAPRTAP